MGFLNQIRPRASGEYTLRTIDLLRQFGGGTSTGVAVNTNSAMRAMAVHSCVSIKANAIGQLPCHLMRTEGEKKNQARDHYLYRLLHDQPNAWMTAPEFWGMASACLDLRGNFYALKSGLPGRPTTELIPLSVGAVQSVVQTPDYGLFYQVIRPGAGTITDTIPGDRIMHLRGLTLDGIIGLNPIEYARESIGLALATEKHGAKLFSQGTMIGGVLTMPPGQFFKDRAKAKEFLNDFNENYSTVTNAHKAALLENGVTWTKMGMTSVDSQFLEARNFQKKEIVDLFFGLPLSMLQSGDKVATYASAEQFALQFVTYTLMPRLVNIERAISRDLLTEEEKKTLFAKFSAQALLRGDSAARATFYREMVNTEIMNPNECRGLEDLNPYDGGDTYKTRTSTVKQDTGEQADQGGAQS
ncbi:MAG TPA: phage portal protein [Dissulfurispiraceae bacterium]|nr:phage portal protein [Dissulfurispiraceae bacterium]